jgi:hypothetical protein
MFYKLYTDGTVHGTSQTDQGEGWQELPECPGDTYRWDGSIKTDGSSNILGFVQVADMFIWKTPILDVNDEDWYYKVITEIIF